MEVKRRLSADEFAELLPELEHVDHASIGATRRVLVDGERLELVAAELKLDLVRVAATIESIWHRRLVVDDRSSGSASLNLALSSGMAEVIKEMARQVEQKETDQDSRAARGRPQAVPLVIPMTDILPDLSRPADEFPLSCRLIEDIRTRGVKRPISVRPHPTMPGKWLINDGHRRFWAARAAGLSSIPHFVDVIFDSYDQINLKHSQDSVSPWVLASFIARKLAEGDAKGYIAQRLGKEQSFVTAHLAMVDAPACLHLAYSKGVASPRTLYDLRRAHDEFPAEVEDWCFKSTEITRKTLQMLLAKLRAS